VPIIGRQMRELGMAGKVFLVGGGELSHPDTVKAATPEVMNGSVEATAWLPEWEHPRSKQFIEDYKKLFAGELPNLHAYTHWETLHLLTAAMQKAGGAKSDDLAKALREISYDGAMGKIVFDDHQQAEVPMVLVEVVGGKAVQRGAFTAKVDYPKR
jgi:branched-chain amino acid transport system substrate-binding protein